MFTGIIPIKTAEGQDELSRRTRRLSQRHRTVLLLVDGKRSADVVLGLAYRAGVPESCYRDLVDLGLIQVPGDAVSAQTVPAALQSPDTGLGALDVVEPIEVSSAHFDLPLDEPVQPPVVAAPPPRAAVVRSSQVPLRAGSVPSVRMGLTVNAASMAPLTAVPPDEPRQTGAVPLEPSASRPMSSTSIVSQEISAEVSDFAPTTGQVPLDGTDSLLPSVRSLLPDSVFSGFGESSRVGLDELPVRDRPFEEAREILIRAVRTEAPVAGSLTLMKLKRTTSRVELEALLDEVEVRISRPRKMITAAQTMRHVRHLLNMSVRTAFMTSK